MYTDIKEKIKDILNVDSIEDINEFDLNVMGSTVNKMANKGNLSIYGFNIKDNKKIVVKKKSSIVVKNTGMLLNKNKSREFEEDYELNNQVLGLKNSDIREHLIYEGILQDLKKYMTEYLGNIHEDNENILLMKHFNKSDDVINNNLVIDFLTDIHTSYLDKEDIVSKFKLNYCSVEEYKNSKNLLTLIYDNFISLYKDRIDKDILEDIKKNIENIDELVKKMYNYHLTFNHGDFSYKNMCLVDDKLLVFDWEMAGYLNPQFDIVTYLSYVDAKYINKKYIDEFIDEYIVSFKNKSGIDLERQEFLDILKLNIKYFFIIRLMDLLVIHSSMPLPHIERVLIGWIELYKNIIED